jgi:hypothetical protein
VHRLNWPATEHRNFAVPWLFLRREVPKRPFEMALPKAAAIDLKQSPSPQGRQQEAPMISMSFAGRQLPARYHF